MKIKSSTYEGLSPEERFRTAIAAISRRDTRELEQLRKTCPRLPFQITDPAYSERVRGFLTLSALTESDLRGYAIDHATAGTSGAKLSKGAVEAMKAAAKGEACSLAVAWGRFVLDLGLEPADASRAGQSRHAEVSALIRDAESWADEDIVAGNLERLHRFFADHVAA